MSYNKSFEALVVGNDEMFENVQRGDVLLYSLEEDGTEYSLEGLGKADKEVVDLGEKKGAFRETYEGPKWDESGLLEDIAGASAEVYSVNSFEVGGSQEDMMESALETVEHEYNEGSLKSLEGLNPQRTDDPASLDAEIPEVRTTAE